MKKTISVLLILVMMLSVLAIAPFTVSAAVTRYTYGDWEYEIWTGYDDKTYESYEEICITNYTGSDEKVIIPNEIDGKPVRYLYNNYIFGNVESPTTDNGNRHFANHKTMTELTIPENLKYIAGWMLMDCTALHDINISSNNQYFEFNSGVLYMKNGTRSWGDHVHYHLDDIENEYGPVFVRSSAGIVNLPSKTTTIYAYAFYNSKLLNVAMTPAAGKLRKIEDCAFYNSTIRGEEDLMGYTSVSIPWGVTEIGYCAFQKCENIRSVHLPETLKKIGMQAFLETNCVSFHLPSGLEEVGDQAFGYARSKVNIYGTPSVVQMVQDANHYESFDEQNPPIGAGGQGALAFNHDPANPFSHIYTNSSSVPPTCTTPGLNILICSCGYQYYSADTVIQPTGHDWTEKKIYSTCTEQGYTLHTCKNCGETYKDNFKKPTGHWKINDPAVEPTATTAGMTAGVHCGSCGLVIEPQTLIPPTGYTEKESGGVKVTAEPEVTPKVTEVTDEATIEGLNLGDDKQAEKVYDIKLEKDGESVHPAGDVIVKIPCDDENAAVYHQEADGTLTDMNAYNDEEGNKVFKANSFSYYVVASHVPEKYPLWVNNEQLTEDHLTVQCGKGTAVYDPKENILTLDNAQITQGAELDQLGTGILSFLDKELTIIVNGDCSITETGGDGIGSYELDDSYQFVPHDITVKGSGKLTITESTPMYGYGIYCTGKLKIMGVDIDITSAATGVWTNKALTVQDSKLNIQCTSKFSGFVVNNGSAVFDNSKVTAESAEGAGILLGNDQDSSAMLISSGTVTLKGKVGVDADTEHAAVSVFGGRLVIEAQDAAFSDTMLTDVDQHILLGEGVEVISGAVDSAAVTIGDAAEPIILGDADGDGVVTIYDATAIQKHLAELPTSSFNEAAADCDGDGFVTIYDATAIQKFLAELPCPAGIGNPV